MKAILLISLLLFSGIVEARDLKVVMFRVFHGDLMYVELPDGRNMIIDSGKEGKPKKFLFPYLRNKGIKKVDYLVLTHMDFDHIGGAKEIIENLPVKKVWYNGHERNTRHQKAFKDAAIAKEIPIEILSTDPFFDRPHTLKIARDVSMEVFHPIEKTESNNLSLVFRLNYKKFSMLFTGDIQIEGQKKIYEKYGNKLKSKVYKVNHHGDSLYTPFINAVSPEISMCPCLKVPLFFPKKKTVKKLKQFGKFYNVRKVGNIELTTDGYDIKIKTFK